MIVPKKIHNGWILKSQGKTYMEIARATGLGWATIQRAIADGSCSPNTMDKINDYLIHGKEVVKVKPQPVADAD